MKSWKVEIGIRDTMAFPMTEEIKVTFLIGEMELEEARAKADEIGFAHSVIGKSLAKYPDPDPEEQCYHQWEEWNHEDQPTRWGKYASEVPTGKDWRWWFLQVREV